MGTPAKVRILACLLHAPPSSFTIPPPPAGQAGPRGTVLSLSLSQTHLHVPAVSPKTRSGTQRWPRRALPSTGGPLKALGSERPSHSPKAGTAQTRSDHPAPRGCHVPVPGPCPPVTAAPRTPGPRPSPVSGPPLRGGAAAGHGRPTPVRAQRPPSPRRRLTPALAGVQSGPPIAVRHPDLLQGVLGQFPRARHPGAEGAPLRGISPAAWPSGHRNPTSRSAPPARRAGSGRACPVLPERVRDPEGLPGAPTRRLDCAGARPRPLTQGGLRRRQAPPRRA